MSKASSGWDNCAAENWMIVRLPSGIWMLDLILKRAVTSPGNYTGCFKTILHAFGCEFLTPQQ